MSRVRVDRYSLTLLPVGLGLVVSVSFLTWWRATLLVLGAFVGRNCLRAGCYALSDLCRREYSKSDNLRVLASSIRDLERASWIDPLTATSMVGVMFLVFPPVRASLPSFHHDRARVRHDRSFETDVNVTGCESPDSTKLLD